MNIVRAGEKTIINLGKQGENNATKVLFDLSPFIQDYGPGVAQLAVTLPNYSTAYAAAIEQDGDIASWLVGSEWLQTAGTAQCQLSWFVNDQLAKSQIYYTRITASIGEGVDAPEPYDGYLQQVQAAGAQAMKGAALATEEANRAKTEAEAEVERAKTEADRAKSEADRAGDIADSVEMLSSAAGGYANEADAARKEAKAASVAASDSAAEAKRHAESAKETDGLAYMYYTVAQETVNQTAQLAAQAKVSAESAKASETTALQALEALLLIDTATGKMATTEAAAAMPIRKLTVNDGTAVETAKAIGKNFFHRDYAAAASNIGVTVAWDAENQEFIFNGTTTAPGDIKIVQPLMIDWIPGEKYTVSVRRVSGTAELAAGTGGTTYGWGIFQDNVSKFIRGATGNSAFVESYLFTATAFELDANRQYIFYFQCWRPGTVFDNYRVKIQIERGSTVTPWEPYRAESVPAAEAQTLMLCKGYNNVVTVPQADITVEYIQDTKLYIDSKIAALVST